jgi:hypothetical protein
MRSPRFIAPASASALVLVLAAHAGAATVLASTIEGLSRASDAVVRGRVEGVASRRQGGRIVTDVAIARAEVWKGSAPAHLTVVVPGGEVDGIGQQVAGAPAFSAGEDVVVFLANAGRGRFGVVGLAQGKYRVEGTTARVKLDGLDRVGPAARTGERDPGDLPLGELRRRVEAAR